MIPPTSHVGTTSVGGLLHVTGWLDLVLGFFLQQLSQQLVVPIPMSRQGKVGLSYPPSVTLKLLLVDVTLHLGLQGDRQQRQHRRAGFRLAGFGWRLYYAGLFGCHGPHSAFRGSARPGKRRRP